MTSTEQDFNVEEMIRKLAIRQTNKLMETWTPEELKQYAFDRLTDELLKKIKR